MKPISTFCVIPDLPDELAPLWDLGHNLWWSWCQEAVLIFHRMDPKAWIDSGRNPLRFLSTLSPEQLAELSSEPELAGRIKGVVSHFEEYRQRQSWFEQSYPDSAMSIAYFSLEFGLVESLPIFSGGLGVLAGDHLKSASDLGLPLVGVGLLYHQGYFQQALNPDGWQTELYPESDFDQMPIQQVAAPSGDPLVVEVPYPRGAVYARVWSVLVGRNALYLLDTNIEQNEPDDRDITSILYGGDGELRIRQEILLGIGGLRALYAMDIRPSICHMNEGHSAFLALERIRILMGEQDFSFEAAREATVAGNIFTTHTPVGAGNDWFPHALVSDYLGAYAGELGLSTEQLLGLGRTNPDDSDGEFCMTVLALRLSAHSNAVSRLHGEVSRQMWSGLWPDVAATEIPITSITNGVHSQTWISPAMADLFDRHTGEGWRYNSSGHNSSGHNSSGENWRELISQIPDAELWAVRQQRRDRLVEYTRCHLASQFDRQGDSRAKIDQLLDQLDKNALTIGFARRFATYKRANLILNDLSRLEALLSDDARPVQILFAGKAHPHDDAGKEMIREIISLSRQEPFAGKVFFLEGYDVNVARYLVQGSDVWLNTPRRPQEASGTSGMKAALNGGLNISVLDGWWSEACELHTGWTVGRGEMYEDPRYWDEVESKTLYDLLESEVIPLFYDRGDDGVPRGWVGRMKEAIGTLVPVFNTHRMVRQYVDELYAPNQSRWEQLNGDRDRIAQLSEWKSNVRQAWPEVNIDHVKADPPAMPKVGTVIPLEATVSLGRLSPEDVRVEIYMGRVDTRHEILQPETVALSYLSSNGDSQHAFSGEYRCSTPGSQGFTLRVLPCHEDLRDPLEMGLVCWA